MEGGELRWARERGGNARTGWWKKVVEISHGNEGRWWGDNLSFKLGDGAEAGFWDQVWVGQESLKERFPRLFRISDNQSGSVRSMGEWVEGLWEWKLGWRRNLFEWEQNLVTELLISIASITPCTGSNDRWRWKATGDGEYSVSSAYKQIQRRRNAENATNGMDEKELLLLWKAPAPYKAIITAWKILKNRIPTCANLVRRNVHINGAEAGCPTCSNPDETVSHAILLCRKADEIWNEILRWIGYQFTSPESTVDHFRSFINLGRRKKTKRVLLGIWVCTVWIIWKSRNECKFMGKAGDSKKITAEIKARLWSWSKVFEVTHRIGNFQGWFASNSLIMEL